MAKRDLEGQRVTFPQGGKGSRLGTYRLLMGAIIVLSVSGRAVCVWAGSSVDPRPAESPAPPTSLSTVPPVAQHITPVLRQLAGVARSSHEVQQDITRIQVEADELKIRLGAVDRELKPLETQQRQLTEQLAVVERKQHERLGLLQRDLEAELRDTLAKTREQSALAPEVRQRLMVKEASLRSTMAALMDKTEREETARVARVKADLRDATLRATELRQQQVRLETRVASLEEQRASQMKHLEHFGAKREAILTRLEEMFRKVTLDARPEALTWLEEMMQGMPTKVTAELDSIHRRLVEDTEQAQQLREQRRVVRERERALQLSREIEEQRRKAAVQQQREQEARLRKVEALMGRAHQLADRGLFDKAIRLLSEAEALDPAQRNTITVIREEFIAEKTRQQRQAHAEKIERLFAKAMEVFERGRYKEAVPLFENVIAQEARLEEEFRMAEGQQP